jgi:hypothetical protein|tara:strand:- start:1226 stop:1630 length:405 start_codon:yes stop_codon:yes gene_type:complete
MILTVQLKNITPNWMWVYENNLQQARDKWDQKAFENGTWIEVINLEGYSPINFNGEYFLPDGDHRCYIAYFEKGITEAKVKIINPIKRMMGDVMEQNKFELYQACKEKVREEGIQGIPDLEERIKSGDWRLDLS